MLKKFSRLLTKIIRQGMEKGEIRNDIPPEKIRDIILGSIEHFSLPKALFGKDIDPEKDSEYLSSIVIEGIKASKEQSL